MKKRIINQHELNGYIAKICRKIFLSKWKPDYIVGISRGGLVPGVMISQYLNVPLWTLNVSLRDGDGGESNLWMAEDAFGYVNKEDREIVTIEGSGIPMESDPTDPKRRKNILIVDDINDTGATLNWIMNDWPSGCFPDDNTWHEVWNNNVKFAVVVDNLASKCNVKIDYVGMEINKAENDVWIDFPWEDWWTK